MIEYLHPLDLTPDHLRMLVVSLSAAPVDVRPDSEDILRALLAERMMAFTFPGGFMIVAISKGDTWNRLVIEAFAGRILDGKQLAADLKRLAADWECDMVETIVFDPRLARAIERVGGRVESMTLTLALEGLSDGR